MKHQFEISGPNKKRNLTVVGMLALIASLYIFNSSMASNLLLRSWFDYKNGRTLESETDVEYAYYVIGNRLVVSTQFDRRLADTKYLDLLIHTFQSPDGLGCG